MLRDAPEVLYKYMNAGTGRIVLSNGTLRWSTPATLNDPFDVQFDLGLVIDKAKAKSAALEKLWEAQYGVEPAVVGNIVGELIANARWSFPATNKVEFDRDFGEVFDESMARMEAVLPELQQNIREKMARSKLLCLTGLPDNPVMWSHYADNHQGIVLQFGAPAGIDSPWRLAKPINYQDDMPRLMDEEFLSDMFAGRVSLDVKELIDRMVYVKASQWSYEREWRLSAADGRSPDAPYEDIPFHPEELEAVVFGARISSFDRAEVGELVSRRYPQAELLQAELGTQAFRITLRRI
jgi:hypothetical protein